MEESRVSLALAQLPDWPAAMNREAALAYTGVAEVQLLEWKRRGKVTFRARGPNGALLALRSDLDAALKDLFENAAAEDMDFGD
jgi:hypothetical protein